MVLEDFEPGSAKLSVEVSLETITIMLVLLDWEL